MPQDFTPVQNFPARVPQTAGYQPIRAAVTKPAVETYLNNWYLHCRREQRSLRQLIEMSVVMRRRFRGLTISDMVSNYGQRRETQGIFIEYDPDLDGEVYPINIVQPLVRANTNACLQSSPSINIESANASAGNKLKASRWEKIYEYISRREWTEEDRTLMFDAIQNDGTILIETYTKKTEKKSTVPDIQSKGTHVAELDCQNCGANELQPVDEQTLGGTPEGVHEIECPKCRKPARGTITSMSAYSMNQQQRAEVQVKKRLVPFYNFVIDSYGAKIGGLDTAKWLMIPKIRTRAEVEIDYPQTTHGSPSEWSYQIQVDYALASGDFSLLNGRQNGAASDREFDLFEEFTIYLHEDAYKNYVAPADYSFVNSNGVEVLKIKAGQTFGEAWEAKYGENPEGLCFVYLNERLVDIKTPTEEETNFRRKFDAVHWLRDSSGFHSSPNYSIVTIQDSITLLNTLKMNIIARNAVIPVYFDSLVFDEDDFGKEFIGTKNAALLDGRGLSDAAMSLEIPKPSPELNEAMQFFWMVKDSVSMVTPAMRGEKQTNETLGAQRQQLQQSYGALTSALKSYAQMLVKTCRQALEFVKKNWTLEQFQAVAASIGEVWTDDDVQELCDIDFESDLLIDYAEGSEMPEGNMEREMKFQAAIERIMLLLKAGAVLAPDVMEQFISHIADAADLDFRLNTLAIDEVIAQKRFIELQKLCMQFAEAPLEEIEALKQKIVGVDEMTMEAITQLDLMIEQLFNESSMRFSKYENLEEQGKFFTEQLRVEIGKEKPNYFLVEAMQMVLEMLEQEIMQIQQDAMMKDPAMQMQLQLEKEAKAGEAEQTDAETEKAAAIDKEKSDDDHEKALEQKQFDHAATLIQQQSQNQADAEAEKAKPKPKSK